MTYQRKMELVAKFKAGASLHDLATEMWERQPRWLLVRRSKPACYDEATAVLRWFLLLLDQRRGKPPREYLRQLKRIEKARKR
jgi:hypothetical protein